MGIDADPSHPRYSSLFSRHLLVEAAKKGMLADSAMIAHGRGEAYDYLLGEQTIPSALEATIEASARLNAAERPIISLNGNVVALCAEKMLILASEIGCPVEVNIFYRTPERMESLLGYLDEIKARLQLDVAILGGKPDARIPGLEGPRAACHREGILKSDAILVPLEDGDRCEALVAMGKDVIVVDLNPLSRSSRMGSVTIVDEVSRVVNNLILAQSNVRKPTDWDNFTCLQSAINHICESLSVRFKADS